MTQRADLTQVAEQVKEVRGRQLPRYPAYKPSGIEWLGDVPEHWSVEKNHARLQMVRETIGADALADREVFHYSIPVIQEIGDGQYEHGSDIDSSKTLIQSRVLLVSKLNPRKNTVIIAEPKNVTTVCSGEFVPLTHVNCDLEYAAYAYRSEQVRQFLDSCVESATRSHQRAKPHHILKLWWSWPPAAEQKAIAAFLDRETAEIDALIARKRRLIELLKEKRTALISHAVTKGLNPKAPMKPSGIDWLGDVPGHWNVKRFGVVASVVRGASPRPAGDPTFFFGDHIPWITVGDVTKDANMLLTSTETMLTPQGRVRSRVFDKGTLVLTNSGATLGVPKILAIQGCANDGIVGFERVSPESCLEYLYFFLCSLTAVFRDRIKQGCGQPNLNTGIVSRTPVLIPPYDEQLRIVGHVSQEIGDIDRLIGRIKTAIDGLGEYRSALISAAVTGKIDVRKEVG